MVAVPASQVLKGSSSLLRQLEVLEPHRTVFAMPSGGIYFFWQLGFMQFMREHFDMSRVVFVGASASGLLATLAACDVEPRKAIESANQIAGEARIWDRTLGLLGIWGGLVQTWLERLLPEDAAQRCSGRVCLLLSQMRMSGFRHVYVDKFHSRQDLISANLATVHIPGLLSWSPFARFRGASFHDGSLHKSALEWEKSKLQPRCSQVFVMDMADDPELQLSWWSMGGLKSYEEVMRLFDRGYSHASQLQRSGRLDMFCK